MDDAVIQIDWRELLTLDQIAGLQNPESDVGIYAVCGPHVVYGDYTLAYIGMTCDTFASRILAPDHPGVEADRRSEIRVHVGRLRNAPVDGSGRESVINMPSRS